jgi:hypothetical protein
MVAVSAGMALRESLHLSPPARRCGYAGTLMVLEVLLALGGFGGALMMTLVQPDDFMPPELLTGTPFNSWVLPGIALLVAIGIVPTIALLAELRRAPWATVGHAGVGGVLIGWILVQLLVIGYCAPPFQIGYLVFGLVILALALLNLREAYRSRAIEERVVVRAGR